MAYLTFHRALKWRLVLLVLFFGIAGTAILARVFALAIAQHGYYVGLADRQHGYSETLPPERGKIFFEDKSGTPYPAAIDKSYTTLVASPKEIVNPQSTAVLLAKQFHLDGADVAAKLSKKNDSYEIIAKDISDDDIRFIQSQGVIGLTLEKDSRRIYPAGSLGAGILGFVNFDGSTEHGAYGIERYDDQLLAGAVGFFEGMHDAAGSVVAISNRILHPPVNGSDVVLTVDRNIQFKTEETLANLMKEWHGESAAAVVMEPATGKILALASLPSFDPGAYSQVTDYSVFRMPVVDSQFELGSVFKPVTIAAGIDAGVITATTTYNDTGAVIFGGYTIRNFDNQGHGVQTMTQVLEKSLNTGAVFTEERLGAARFLDYIKRFGFGEKTGIDFPGEVSGSIANLVGGHDLEYATAAFGQGIAVTPLQMASAIAAIANNGVAMTPYIVEKTIDDSGNTQTFSPKAKGQVITQETAEMVTKMLVSAVQNGFDRASVPGYFVAGKTGTAQIPDPNHRGYSDALIHTFVGYAPAFHPRFLILIQLNKPQGNRFASNTLSPAFSGLMKFILDYYEIPPDQQ